MIILKIIITMNLQMMIGAFSDDLVDLFESNKISATNIEAYLCSNIYSIRIQSRITKLLSMKNIFMRVNDIEGEILVSSSEFIHKITFLTDLRCQGVQELLRKAEEKMLLNAPCKWILYGTKEFINRINTSYENENINVISNLKILPDSDINLLYRNTDNDSFNTISVYRRNESQSLVIEKSLENPIALRRINLRQTTIRICYVLTNNDSLHHLSDYMYKEIDTITKVNYVLTNHLIDFLNASRSFSFVSSWGYRDSDDGSWSGMMGKLTKKEADVGGSPLFFTSDRIPVIDYIAMPTPTRSKFVFRQPKLSYLSNVFVLPFRGGVWGCSLGLVVVLSIFLYISSKWEWIYLGNVIQNESDSETLRARWSDVIIMTLGAICQQGSNVQLRGPVGRIVILLLFLSLMFLYTSYSANIVALLQSSSSRIKTLPDLLNSRLKMAVHDTVFNRHYFSTATEPIRKAIYQKKIAPPGEPPRFISLEDGVKKLRGGLFAFHMETGVGYKVVGELFLEGEKCGLQEIQYLQVIDPWLAVQKNSSYKEMFKIGFRRLQEHGLQTRENWLLYTKKPKCAGTGSNFISVGMVDCRPAMMVLAYGGLVSIICLIMEVLTFRRQYCFRLRIQGA